MGKTAKRMWAYSKHANQVSFPVSVRRFRTIIQMAQWLLLNSHCSLFSFLSFGDNVIVCRVSNDPWEQPYSTNRHFCQTHHQRCAHWFVLPLKWAVSSTLGTAVIASCLNDSNKAFYCSYLRFPSRSCHCHPHLFHYRFSRLDKTAGVPHSTALRQPGWDKEVVKRGNKSHQMERLLFVQPSYGKLIAASRILNRCNKCWRRRNLLLIGSRGWKYWYSPFSI